MKQKLLLKTMLLLFALIAGSSSVWAGSITFSELGLTNGQQYSDPFDGGDFTVTFGGGGNDGKYYTEGPGIRVYGGGTMTIAGKGANISHVVITYAGSNAPASDDVVKVGTYDPTTHTWTGNAATVVFTRPSGSGHWRVKSISVNQFTWDLSTDKTATATTTEMTWTSTYASMRVDKGSASTNTNNYYPGTEGQSYTSTRFYKNSILTITPVSGYSISSVVFTATTTGYADALQGSAWTNATASIDDKTVTVTPTDGSSAISATIGGLCGFTAVKVCYGPSTVSKTITAAGWATYCSPYALDFSSTIANLDGAYIVTGNTGTTLNLSPAITTTVPANTGLLLKGSGEVTIPVAASGAYVTTGNKLHGVTVATEKDPETIYVLMNEAAGVGFYKNSNAFTVGANTAYLAVGELEGFEGGGSAPKFMAIGDDNNGTTGVETLNVERGTLNDNSYYNLNGQRVAQPTKGLYIVNGRKVVIK